MGLPKSKESPAGPAQVVSNELLCALQNPELYDHPVNRFSLIETHISWVLLTGDFAYKIKKPVKLDFLDFSTLEKRRHYCADELRLNQRFAPDLYLQVVTIKGSTTRPRFGGKGKVIEYAVKMREFPQQNLLSIMAAERRLQIGHIDSMAKMIAGFHSDVPAMGPEHLSGTIEIITKWSRGNFENIEASIPLNLLPDYYSELKNWSLSTDSNRLSTMRDRLTNGFVRECHGDLHLGNMVLIDEKVRMFDCIEFNAELRWIDTLSEVAFVAMDLHARTSPEFCWRFINRYLEITGDYAGITLLRYYFVYRALVRAKVEVLRVAQEKSPAVGKRTDYQTAFHYMDLAHSWARSPPGSIIIMHGLSGSGKSTLAGQLVQKLGGIQLRSDVERKRLFDLWPSDDSQSPLGQGIYTGDATKQTYDLLAELAKTIVTAGFTAIVDASFLKRSQRDQFIQLARECKVSFTMISCEAPENVLRERIRQRRQINQDASDANLAVLAHQLESQEPVDAEEREKTFIMNCSEAEPGQEQLKTLIQHMKFQD